VAYDEFTMANLMAGLKDAKGALSLERQALASFKQLATADPANMQLQQDIAELRADIGEMLIKLGDLSGAEEELKKSLDSAEKLRSVENPQLAPGRIVATDEFRLGKVYFLMASAKESTARQRVENCRKAEQWFQKGLPAIEFLKDHPTPGQDDTGRPAEVRRFMAECRSRAQLH
jgi:tetratricopeptide (TPR) repeat protein